MLPLDLKEPIYGFRTKCGHAWQHIHLFRTEEDDFMFFRPRCASEDWLGTFQGDVYASKFRRPRTSKRVERVIRSQLAQSHIWRVFHLPDSRAGERRIWRISWRPDYGYAQPLGQDTELSGAYFWPRPAKFNLWRTPTEVLQRHFEREWYDPQSDVRAALPWCDLSYEKREVRAVQWKRGNLQELKQLVTAALQFITFTNGEFSSDPVYPIYFWLNWNEESQRIYLDVSRYVEMNPDMRCWRRLHARINEHHQGIYDLPSGSRNDWKFPWVDYEPHFSTLRGARVGFDVSEPTQHERLEASLFLRDWLSKNAPDLLADWFV